MLRAQHHACIASLIVALAYPACAEEGGNAKPPAPRPHIVYIIADDLGWKDVGFNGSDIKTPNIDALAAGGARIEEFYSQPMCTPTRAALMTGRYPFRYGLQSGVIPDGGTYSLPLDERLLPQALAAAGYRTAMVGKWHLGHAKKEFWPRQRGFASHYGSMIGEIDYFEHDTHHTLDWYRDDQPVEEEGYSTTLFGAEAVRIIAGHDPKTPLFLYLAFNAPHAPYQAPQEAIDRYLGIEDPTRRTYAAMITTMDEAVGKVVTALGERGMRDNTLIVFESDNGGVRSAMFSGNIDVGKINLPYDNGPYRDGKGSTYEGGTRVPAVVNWPGKIAPGTTVAGPMHVVDMYPTLLGLAGADTSGGKPLDGFDQWPTLAAGQPSPRNEVVYNLEPWGATIRQGQWKLVWKTMLPMREELFDIAKDPYEKDNLAASHPEIVAKLKARAQELALQSAPPLLVAENKMVLKDALFGSGPIFPGQDEE